MLQSTALLSYEWMSGSETTLEQGMISIRSTCFPEKGVFYGETKETPFLGNDLL
jgi:hypothetical protein